MKRYLGIVFLLILAGCKNHVLTNKSAVKMIRVVRYRDAHDSIIINYTGYIKIRHIINAINDSKKESLYFKSNCKLHIIYADSTVAILCNGSSIQYKGATYKMNDSMEDVLN